MAIFPLAIAGAVIGGGFRALEADRRNRAIRAAAELSQKRVNKFMVQARMDRAIQTEQLSRAAQRALGAGLNTSPNRQGALEAMSLELGGVFIDQFAIDTELDRRLEALGASKMNIATEATNQSKNVLLEGLQGALAGGQVGASVGSSINEARSASATSAFSEELQGLQVEEQRANTGLAKLQFGQAKNLLGAANERVGRGNQSLNVVNNVVQFR